MKVITTLLFPSRPLKLNVKANINERVFISVPDEASQESEGSLTDEQDESREQLNHFLQARDISPVRHVLSVPWNEAQSRSKRRYVRKAEQCVSAVLDVLAPKDACGMNYVSAKGI